MSGQAPAPGQADGRVPFHWHGTMAEFDAEVRRRWIESSERLGLDHGMPNAAAALAAQEETAPGQAAREALEATFRRTFALHPGDFKAKYEQARDAVMAAADAYALAAQERPAPPLCACAHTAARHVTEGCMEPDCCCTLPFRDTGEAQPSRRWTEKLGPVVACEHDHDAEQRQITRLTALLAVSEAERDGLRRQCDNLRALLDDFTHAVIDLDARGAIVKAAHAVRKKAGMTVIDGFSKPAGQ